MAEVGGVVAAELLAVVLAAELLALVLAAELLAVVLELLVAEPLEPQAASSIEQATAPSSFAGI